MRPGARASGLPFSLERYNVAYMAFFSVIVVGGTLYSLVHGTHTYNVFLSDPQAVVSAATATSSSSGLASLVPSRPATFLADRRNLLNRVFIKFAWFWTTAAFVAQVSTLRVQTSVRADGIKAASASDSSSSASKETGSSAVREKQERQDRQKAATSTTSTTTPQSDSANLQATVMGAMSVSLFRYVVATLLWIFFARWFLGPPLMERVRHYSGGVCTPLHSVSSSSASPIKNALLPSTIEPSYCYSGRSLAVRENPTLFAALLADTASSASATDAILRPRWKGGHDISGHTYILIVASLYLLEEITPFLPYLLPATLQSHITVLIPRALWAPDNPFAEATYGSQALARRNLIAITAVLALLCFWTVSLAVTSVYFHTPQEKLSGLLVSLAASLLIPKGG